MDPARRLARPRREHLLKELHLRGSVRSSEVARHLGVTEMTVRRDLARLEGEGLLVRVHGGAIPPASPPRQGAARTTLGLVLPGAGSHFPEIVRGAEEAARRASSRILLASTDYRDPRERRQVERLVDLGVDGVIIAPTLRGRSVAELVEHLAAVPVPVVLVERRFDDEPAMAGYDWICTDQVRGVVQALEHLRDGGHARVGLALLERTPIASSVAEGFDQGVRALGLAAGPRCALPKDSGGSDHADAALGAFLEDCRRGDTRAVLVHTDFYAARLVEIALDRGIAVPDELAVVAYDDEFAELCVVPLTAVSPPGREIGRLAVQTLGDRLRAGEDSPVPPRHVLLVPPLRVRASSGPPVRAATGPAAAAGPAADPAGQA